MFLASSHGTSPDSSGSDILEDLGQGGYIAADIIEDNPRAHSSFPIDLKVESCGLLDNSLECEQEAEDDIEGLPGKAERAYGDPTSKGTDIFGALANAEHFLSRHESPVVSPFGSPTVGSGQI